MFFRKVNNNPKVHNKRKENSPDIITPHANRLVSYMNTHPATILGYAKYYGEVSNAVSARMTDIDSTGFVIAVKEEDGLESEIHIRFKSPLRSYNEVRPTLTRMAQEAEEALNLPSTAPPPSMMSDSSSPTSHTPFIMPGRIDLSITIFVIITLLTIAFYPYSTPTIIKEIRDFFGTNLININLIILVIFHTVEALIAFIVLTMRSEKDTMTLVKWVAATLIYGHVWLLFKDQRKED
ncbi:4988_t:CDS:2 [Funneliformis geosporum]|uniref:5820_t:CDS:1 n=1 Tax=Funneliformis geosporum TaxID=1117311 RepID=A0A9W4SNG6_9GLOM|nr:4988_t:CDS:2 [Funneliformis geosporum]CAI2173385.1 5820_t:CDS:2 [Funneliformis geosporum]